MRIFSTSNVVSTDVQVYGAGVQMAEHSAWFPALRHLKAAYVFHQIWNSSVQLAGGGVPTAALCFLHTIHIHNCISAENTVCMLKAVV